MPAPSSGVELLQALKEIMLGSRPADESMVIHARGADAALEWLMRVHDSQVAPKRLGMLYTEAPTFLHPPASSWRVEQISVEPIDINAKLEERLGALAPGGAVDLTKHRTSTTREAGLLDPWLASDPPNSIAPWIVEAALRVQSEANVLLPTFVADAGAVVVELLPPVFWRSGEPRVNARFRFRSPLTLEPESESRAIEVIGAGHRRWASVTLLEASRRLTTPPETTVIHLVDEPELHLHPMAISDVVDWLADRVGEGHLVVAATHSPIVLNERTTRVIGALKTDGGPTLVDLTTSVMDSLRELAPELGLRPGDWVMSARGVLVVEGQHDLLVVQKFFGTELNEARIVPVAMRGMKNVLALAELNFFRNLRRPVRIILDNTRAEALNGDADIDDLTDEERRITSLDKELLRQLQMEKRHGMDLHVA